MSKLLMLGIVVSFFLAVVQVNSELINSLPENASIKVDGHIIDRIEFATALAIVQDEKRDALNSADFTLVIKRLVDEQLLFVYGLANGVIQDPNIRLQISKNMLSNISAHIDTRLYNGAELIPLYDKYQRLLREQSPDRVIAGFEEIKDDLTEVYRQQQRDAALKEYVDTLRRQATITEVQK